MLVGKFCKGMQICPDNFVFVCLLEFSFTVILKEILAAKNTTETSSCK